MPGSVAAEEQKAPTGSLGEIRCMPTNSLALPGHWVDEDNPARPAGVSTIQSTRSGDRDEEMKQNTQVLKLGM